MRVPVNGAEILAVVLQGALFVPALGHTWIVHPVVEKPQMLLALPIEDNHGKGLLDMGNPSAVDEGAGSGLCWPDRMI